MHDIWNPWHGCTKVSEGCDRCYMYTMDRARGLDGALVRRNASTFRYPLAKNRDGSYKVRAGELIRICMASCLPADWGAGWKNVMLNVTAENQRRAEERIPILLATPARHRGIMCAPFLGPVDAEPYLATGKIEQVICGGENYDGARPCDFAWVQALSRQCRAHDVTFAFIETGNVLVKDGRTYRLRGKALQAEQAYKAGVAHRGRPIVWELTDPLGMPVPEEELYRPRYRARCRLCGSRLICNGCANCGQCGEAAVPLMTEEELAQA